ncbi:hypothetical protein FRX31_009876 [Thalictrum thalictroides]|uniref:Cytochrome p450 n=1 Tax=Thalictrum thalictroides TaxID=46969 RepID=A0A7J6WU27_THATH|nr:hypothetical protein FRX31_009876 [Thalictrum thalictroides]
MTTTGFNFLSWHGYIPQLSVNQPDLIKEVLNNGNELLYPKPEPQPYLKKLLGDGLATIKGGKKWSKKRQNVHCVTYSIPGRASWFLMAWPLDKSFLSLPSSFQFPNMADPSLM